MSFNKVYKLDEKITPDTILDMLPEIKKAEVLFKVGEDTSLIHTPFTGFVNEFEGTGEVIPIKAVKSKRYAELSHKYTFETVINELQALGENLYIQRSTHNGDWSILKTSIIMDKPFALAEVPFELGLGEVPEYMEGGGKEDVFYPMITVTNSFLGCSEVTFDLYRSFCDNGLLFGKMLNKTLRFRHFGDVIGKFNTQTEKFLAEIFESRFINNIFEEYSGRNMTKKELQTFSEEHLGKRIAKDIDENGVFTLPKEMNTWIALQVITYYTTHFLKNQDRGVRALSAFSKTIHGEG